MIERALELARQGRWLPPPNPSVGCVITAADGRVIGEGQTQRAGEAHAEVMALRDAARRGEAVRGSTVHVTLEPCAHHGRTPPCCDALVDAGVARVVVSMADPNPRVAGQGIARLRAAGIEVTVGSGAREAFELNIGFFSRMRRGRPWVRLKVAASLDGRTALDNGQSQWITSPAARADGHAWRARACAMLTGIGTVLEDDPQLDVRLVDTARQPHLVVVDSRLETPLQARLLAPQRQVWLYAATAAHEREAALAQHGVQVTALPGPGQKVDLAAMLDDLGRREVNELHVEAGHKLNGSLIHAGLVDEFLVYLAPKLIGPGREMAVLPALPHLDKALALDFHNVTQVGPDLRLLARPPGRDNF